MRMLRFPLALTDADVAKKRVKLAIQLSTNVGYFLFAMKEANYGSWGERTVFLHIFTMN